MNNNLNVYKTEDVAKVLMLSAYPKLFRSIYTTGAHLSPIFFGVSKISTYCIFNTYAISAILGKG